MVRTNFTAMMPGWFLLTYTAFVLVLVPVYAVTYPLSNFLWFSNLCLLLGLVAAWTRQPLLASIPLVAVGLVEIGWVVDFLGGLLLGGNPPLGAVGYMFDPSIPFLVRGLSLYHLFLPFALLFMVWRFGLHPRAAHWCIGIGWLHLILVWLLTDPSENINWVFHPAGGSPRAGLAGMLWLGVLMAGLALIWSITFLLCRSLLNVLPAPPRSRKIKG